MLDCVILGDSIAVAAHQLKPSCAAYAVGGVTSLGWKRRFVLNDLASNVVIISLGTNDPPGADTYSTLVSIRQNIKSSNVYWIAPNQHVKPQAYRDVKAVAAMFGDQLLTTKRYQKDNIHPATAGHKEMLESVK